MNRKTFFLALSFLPAGTLAQEAAKQPPKLLPAPTEWRTTELNATSIADKIVCDVHSTMYFRLDEAKTNPFEGKITILSVDGKSRTIEPKAGTGLQGRVIFSGLNVDRAGNIYIVGNSSEEKNSYLVAYDAGGHYMWKSALPLPIHASYVLPMANSRFLVSGILPRKTAEDNFESATLLVDARGNAIKSLKAADDDAGQVKDDQGNYVNRTIQQSNARIGADGMVYVLKASSPAKIQEIDQNGNLQKTLELTSPAAGARAYDFFVEKDSFVVAYMPANDDAPLTQGNVMLYDAKSGVLKGRYQTQPRGILACGQDNMLTYLGPTPDHKLYHVGTVKMSAN